VLEFQQFKHSALVILVFEVLLDFSSILCAAGGCIPGGGEPANCVMLPASQVSNSIRAHGSAPVVARSPPVDAST